MVKLECWVNLRLEYRTLRTTGLRPWISKSTGVTQSTGRKWATGESRVATKERKEITFSYEKD
ncbi:MAG: hypothetical protein M1835_003008 [Candelina submexicana]|nr:MAG: hypothetical protein M1835_003008 [Candelina submexicana]